MRRGHQGALAVMLALALAVLGAAGCGDELGHEADEGVPIKLGDLEFNVQETRFLNPSQPDDGVYLTGQQLPPPPSQSYLGVFLTVHNDADDPVKLPTYADVSVVDTTGVAYEAIPSSSPFAAPLGTEIEAGGDVPAPDTAAESGPVQGALLIFLVSEAVNENRPLKLEIDYEDETGEITLDI